MQRQDSEQQTRKVQGDEEYKVALGKCVVHSTDQLGMDDFIALCYLMFLFVLALFGIFSLEQGEDRRNGPYADYEDEHL